MKLLSLPECGTEAAAEALCRALRTPGGVVLLPTETVYGLAARVSDEEARQRIFELKNRSASKRLGCFAADSKTLLAMGVLLDGLPGELVHRYTPGPITIIAPCRDGSTLGFRIPDHPLLSALLRRMGEPLWQTSANASGQPDALTAEAACAMLTGEVDCAVDGGPLPPGACGSTVVDATGKTPKILRQGILRLD